METAHQDPGTDARKDCRSCEWFREAGPQNSPATALAWLVKSPQGDVFNEIKRIEGEEYGKRSAEEQEMKLKRERAIAMLSEIGVDFYSPESADGTDASLMNTMRMRLPRRFEGVPQAVSHCAKHAPRHYFLHEIKNWDERCTDYEPRTTQANCKTCTHYRVPVGDVEDAATLNELATAIQSLDQSAQGTLESRIQTIQASIGPAKALEMSLAYNSRGLLQQRLRYFPYCEQRSPELVNRFGFCGEYVEGAPPATVDTAPESIIQPVFRPPEAGAPAPANTAGHRSTRRRTVLEQLGISPFEEDGSVIPDRSAAAMDAVKEQAFDTFRNVAGAIGKAIAGNGRSRHRDPDEIAQEKLAVIVEGPPPLTNEMLRRSVEMARRTQQASAIDKREEWTQAVIRSWSDEEARKLQLELIRLYRENWYAREVQEQAAALVQRFAIRLKQAAERTPTVSAATQVR